MTECPVPHCDEMENLESKVDTRFDKLEMQLTNIEVQTAEIKAKKISWRAMGVISLALFGSIIFVIIYFSDIRAAAKDFIKAKESMDESIKVISRNQKTTENNENGLAATNSRMDKYEIRMDKFETEYINQLKEQNQRYQEILNRLPRKK